MNKRIQKIFKTKTKKLVTFVTGGDPNFEISVNIIKKILESGSDLIEIGMPFSDPMADGPIIQFSSKRAIKKNIDLNKIFLIAKEIRKINKDVPIILMGYYNPIHFYGNKLFIKKCLSAGIDGLIIVDLQPEEDNELYKIAKYNNIDIIRLITPTTDKKRLKIILSNASGFLYYVSITGVTGKNSADLKILEKSIKSIKRYSSLPILVGFGIKNKFQAKKISNFSDGVIIGSVVVSIIEKYFYNKINKTVMIKNISSFVKSIVRTIN